MQSANALVPAPAVPPEAKHEGKAAKIADIERLRGYAILFVVFIHLPFSAYLFVKLGLDHVRRPCWLAVHLFFVISGYVVCKSFIASKLSIWRFYIRRIFRLWPVMAVFLAFSALVNCLPTFARVPWGAWLRQVPPIFLGYFTVPLLREGATIFYNNALWSLSVEEQFYMVMPAVLALLWLVIRSDRNRMCGWFFAGVYLAIACVIRLSLVYEQRLGIDARAFWPWPVQYIAIWQFDFIALGVILYFRMQQGRFALARASFATQRVLAYVFLAAPFLVMYPLGNGIFLPWDQPGIYPFGLMAAGLGFYALIGLAALDRDLLYTTRFLDRVLLYWGSRSYGIYVLHYPILALALWLLPEQAPIAFFNRHRLLYEGVRGLWAIAVGFPVVELTYRYIEQPGIDLGRRLIQRLGGTKPSQAAPPESGATLRAA